MSLLEIIVRNLQALPPSKLEEAAVYVRRLRETSRMEPLAAIRTEAEDAEAKGIVTECCEKIEGREQ